MESASEPDYVITLIHGTWARNAPWVNDPKSVLRAQLAEKLAPATVVFEPFNWSGGNSHIARYRGALALRRVLRAQSLRSPRSRRVLVTHSHGGNVAAYALRDAATAGRVSGMVSLGTPFIDCASRDLAAVAEAWRLGVTLATAYILGCLVSLFCWLLLARPTVPAEGVLPAVSVVPPAVFVVAWAVLYLVYQPSIPKLRRWGRDQNRLVRRFASPTALSVPLLCCIAARDEARFALGAVAAVPKGVGCMVWFLRWWQPLCLLIAILLGGVPLVRKVVNGVEFDDFDRDFYPIWAVIVVGFLVSVKLMKGIGALFWGIASVTAQRVGYGGGASRLLTVRQSLTPHGATNAITEPFRPFGRFFGWTGLQHSWLYKSPEVVERIAGWIRRHVPHTGDAA